MSEDPTAASGTLSLMERHQFAALYAEAQQHRNQLRGSSQLAAFFPPDSQSLPPVLGFGLPHDNRPVPVVTIALNASVGEFSGGHLPIEDDVQAQWVAQANYFANPYEGWWGIAGDMLGAATDGRLTYAGPGPIAAHVDFTGVVTTAGMDTTYDPIKARARAAVRSWLERSLTGTFVQLLSSLVQQNGTKAALVFGFAPAFPGKQDRSGSITLRDTFWGENERVNFVGDGGVAGERRQPTISWGRMTGRSVPENLRRLPFFFVSQGPSSLFSGQRDEVTRVPLRAAAAGLAARLVAALAS
ncbi:hypothetical protein NR798_45785 [Archangium gephyra]|uniref:hypothetical protein n=1 Tax=Archangium gephyra TaxID=48 RepID=UPI0035D3FF7B